MRFLGNAERLILISCKNYYLVNRIKLLPVRHYLELCSTSEGEKSLLSALGTPTISDKELMFLNIISKLPLQFFSPPTHVASPQRLKQKEKEA